MENARIHRLFSLARAGQLSRRQLLETGLRLGLATPVILSLIEAAPESAAASVVTQCSLPFASALGSGSNEWDAPGAHYFRHGRYRSALFVFDPIVNGRARRLRDAAHPQR